MTRPSRWSGGLAVVASLLLLLLCCFSVPASVAGLRFAPRVDTYSQHIYNCSKPTAVRVHPVTSQLFIACDDAGLALMDLSVSVGSSTSSPSTIIASPLLCPNARDIGFSYTNSSLIYVTCSAESGGGLMELYVPPGSTGAGVSARFIVSSDICGAMTGVADTEADGTIFAGCPKRGGIIALPANQAPVLDLVPQNCTQVLQLQRSGRLGLNGAILLYATCIGQGAVQISITFAPSVSASSSLSAPPLPPLMLTASTAVLVSNAQCPVSDSSNGAVEVDDVEGTVFVSCNIAEAGENDVTVLRMNVTTGAPFAQTDAFWGGVEGCMPPIRQVSIGVSLHSLLATCSGTSDGGSGIKFLSGALPSRNVNFVTSAALCVSPTTVTVHRDLGMVLAGCAGVGVIVASGTVTAQVMPLGGICTPLTLSAWNESIYIGCREPVVVSVRGEVTLALTDNTPQVGEIVINPQTGSAYLAAAELPFMLIYDGWDTPAQRLRPLLLPLVCVAAQAVDYLNADAGEVTYVACLESGVWALVGGSVLSNTSVLPVTELVPHLIVPISMCAGPTSLHIDRSNANMFISCELSANATSPSVVMARLNISTGMLQRVPDAVSVLAINSQATQPKDLALDADSSLLFVCGANGVSLFNTSSRTMLAQGYGGSSFCACTAVDIDRSDPDSVYVSCFVSGVIQLRSASPPLVLISATDCPNPSNLIFATGIIYASCGIGSVVGTSLAFNCFPGNHWSQGECVPCSRGYYRDVTMIAGGLRACEQCPPDSVAPAIGSASCTVCEAGQMLVAPAIAVNENTCVDCTFGTYSAVAGSYTCLPCGPGTFANKSGLSMCFDCDLGSYVLPSRDSCLICGVDSYTPFIGSQCVPCGSVNGLKCGNGLAAVLSGFYAWVDQTSGELLASECPFEACTATQLQRSVGNSANFSANATAPFMSLLPQCPYPRVDSPLCASCAAGYASWNGDCLPCDGFSAGYLFLSLFLSSVLVFFLYQTSSGGSALLVVLLYFGQIADVEVGNIGSILSFMHAFNYSPHYSGKCIAPLSPQYQMALILISPYIFLAFLAAGCGLHRITWMHLRRTQPQSKWTMRLRFNSDRYVACIHSIFLFTFTSVANSAASFLYCVPVANRSVVFAMANVDCSSAEYASLFALVCITASLHLFLLPLAALLYLHHKRDLVQMAHHFHAVSVARVASLASAGSPVKTAANSTAPRNGSGVGGGGAGDLMYEDDDDGGVLGSWDDRSFADLDHPPMRSVSFLAVQSLDTALLQHAESDLFPSNRGQKVPSREHSLAASDVSSLALAEGAPPPELHRFLARCGPLFGMFASNAWYWQFVLLVRRLLMAALLAAFPLNSQWKDRYMSFTLIHLFALLAHSQVQPFHRARHNHAEAVAQVLLLALSAVLTAHDPPFASSLQAVFCVLLLPFSALLFFGIAHEKFGLIKRKLRKLKGVAMNQ